MFNMMKKAQMSRVLLINDKISFARVTTQQYVTHGQPETSTPNCQQATKPTKAALTVSLIVKKFPSL